MYNLKIAYILILLFVIFNSKAQPVTWDGGASTSNWSDANNWNPNGVPTSTSDVTIGDNFNVVVNSDVVCNSLTISTGSNISSLTINSGSLTVSGATTISANSNNDYKYIHINGGSFSTASVTLNSTGNTRDAFIQISTGTCTVSGNITMNGTNVRTYIYFTGSGTLNIGGNFAGTGGITSAAGGGTTAPTNGTVNFNGTGAQTIPVFNGYYNLSISGNRTSNNVTFPNGGIVNISNVFSPTATFTTGNYIVTGNTINFNGTSDQNIPSFNFNNLTKVFHCTLETF